MTLDQFNHHVEELHNHARRIAAAKRPGYTVNSPDVLANFKNVADRLNLTPLQAWGVYFLKHVDALTTYARDPNIPQAEEIMGRYADAANYIDLGWALAQEKPVVTKEPTRT